jgi:Xaa-Pro aminopeptidase
MKTITIQLQEDKDAQLLMDMLRSVKFEGEIEAFEELETISEEELQMLSDRVEEYRKDPSKGKDLKDMELILSKYGI